jgi:endogenous inhibitor of DNA gyrase (YacG/DUF329 family)
MNCPTCGKPAEWKDNPYRPFCSERCKLVDLGRWVNEEYRVPGGEIPVAGRHEPEQDAHSTEDDQRV